MRVLYITNDSSFYGANLSLFSMLLLLRKEFEVEPVVLLRESGALSDALRHEKVPTIVGKYQHAVVRRGKSFFYIRMMVKRIIKIPSYYLLMTKVKKEGKYDLVHSNSGVVDIGYYLCKWMKIPHVWHIREFGEDDHGLCSINSKKRMKEMLCKAESVIAISGSIKTMLLQMGGSLDICYVPNGILIPPEMHKVYCGGGEVTFCVVGGLHRGKGQEDVIRASGELEKRGIDGYKVIFIGDGNKKYKDALIELISRLKVESKVKMLGYRNDVCELLKNYDVGIMASRKEAFGRVTLEYMANYMAVIGTNSGGTPELVDEKNGFTYRFGDYINLADHMEYFIKHPADLEVMGKISRERSLNYRAEENARQVYEIYRSALNEKSR